MQIIYIRPPTLAMYSTWVVLLLTPSG